VGSDKGTAVAAIQAAGFVPVITTVKVKDPSRDNIVVSQDPPGGAQRKQGTHVTIVVGQFGPQPTPTPTPSPGGGAPVGGGGPVGGGAPQQLAPDIRIDRRPLWY
jgi:hypothetical protein